jgi:hypothetical protein
MRIPSPKIIPASYPARTVRHIRMLVIIQALLLGVFLHGVVWAAALDYTFIEANYLPALKNVQAAAVGRPLGEDGPWHMAVPHEGRVHLYEISAETTAPYRELVGMPSPAVSVAFADYNNDGRDDLWVGSAGSGNIYVYDLTEYYPMLGRSTGRLWTPIVKLLTPDIDGDSFPDAVALSETGAVHVFLQRPEGLVSLWSSGPREGKVRHLFAYDINNDGRDEVILARDGYAAVWQWRTHEEERISSDLALAQAVTQFPAPELGAAVITPLVPPEKVVSTAKGLLVQLWEHDAFQGAVRRLAVGNFDGQRFPELLISTSADRLYTVVVNSQRNMSIGNIIAESAIAPALYGSVELETMDLLLGSESDHLTIWRQQDGINAYEVVWQSAYPVKYTEALQAGDHIILFGTDGTRFFEKVSVNYVRIMIDGKPYSDLQAPPLAVSGDVYLSVSDWAILLDLPAPGLHPNGRVTLFNGLQYLIATVGNPDVLLGLRSVTVDHAPRNIDGTAYLSAQTVNLLTGTIKWQPQIHTLTIR